MYCRKCGKELEEGSQFCRHCGTPVIVPPTLQNKVPPAPVPAPITAIKETAEPEKSVQAEPENESGVDLVQDVQPEQTEGKAEKKKGTGKKIIKWFFRLLLIAVLALVFVGALFNGNFDSILKLHQRAGFWTVSSSTTYVPNRDYVWMELNKDGTGTLNMGWGDVRSVKWYDGFQSGHFDIQGQKTEFNYSGQNGSFAIKIDGNLVFFYKTEKPVPYDDVSIVKAEVTEDVNGLPALRVYYNWTNKTDHPQVPICAWGHPWYVVHLGQPGGYKEHAEVSEEDLVPEDYENYLKETAPGETVCLAQVLKYNPNEDAVAILYRFDACSTFTCDVYLLEEQVLSGWDDMQGNQTTAKIAKGTLEITESVENKWLDRD